MTASGWASARSSARSHPPSTTTVPASSASSRVSTTRVARPHVRPQRRLGPRRAAVCGHCEHRAGVAADRKCTQRATSSDGAVDHDGTECLAHRGFERRLPALVDLDEIGERADRALDFTPASLDAVVVQREGEGLFARRPHVAVLVGGPVLVLRAGELVLTRCLPVLGGLHTGDERPLGLFGLLARAPVQIGVGGELRGAGLDRLEPSLDPGELADRALDRRRGEPRAHRAPRPPAAAGRLRARASREPRLGRAQPARRRARLRPARRDRLRARTPSPACRPR